MGVAQKPMFSVSDHRANIFSISGAPMEHNATAKSKETLFFITSLKYDSKILLYENLLHTPSNGKIFSEYPGLHSN